MRDSRLNAKDGKGTPVLQERKDGESVPEATQSIRPSFSDRSMRRKTIYIFPREAVD